MSVTTTKKVNFRVSMEDLELMASIRDDHGFTSLSDVVALLVEHHRSAKREQKPSHLLSTKPF